MNDAAAKRRIATVALVVADYDEAIAWYTQKLGFALTDDIDLGEGMDGAQLAKLAREMRPKLPVVYASGRRTMEQFSTVPNSIFLPKPYSLSQVDQTLARIQQAG